MSVINEQRILFVPSNFPLSIVVWQFLIFYIISMTNTFILILLTLSTLTNCTIVITSPIQTQFKNNQIQYKYGNFGEIPYGKTISATLEVSNLSFCGNQNITHFNKPTFVVIQATMHNTCAYTKRARNAQAKGVQGIIIASPGYDYSEGNIYLSDDGNGKKVHISVFFISNANFYKLQKIKNLQIKANFPIPKEPISTLSIFLSASKRSSYIFLRQLQSKYEYIQNHIKIQPIYHTITCQFCSPQNCVMQYCSFDYQNWSFQEGNKIVTQQLHQYAIFKQKGIEKWMEYMNKFDDYCMGNWENIDTCSKQIQKQIDAKGIYPFNPDETMRLWSSKQTQYGFDTFPEVAINNMIYRGNFDFQEIMEAFCMSLSQPPPYCTDGSYIVDKQGEQQQQGNIDHLIIILTVTITLVIGIAVLIRFLYPHFIQKEITSDTTGQVNELVAHYANKVNKQKIRQRQKFIEAHDEQL